jgi:hypothetical protein
MIAVPMVTFLEQAAMMTISVVETPQENVPSHSIM